MTKTMKNVLSSAAQKAARTTGFVQRKSKLTGELFVQTLVFGFLSQPTASWETLASVAAGLGVPITGSGLLQRCTETAAAWVHEVLKAAMQRIVQPDPVAIPLLQRFNGVFVEDSTVIALPSERASVWPGGNPATGTTATSKARVRVDLLSGAFSHGQWHAGRIHAMACAAPVTDLPPGALLINDLGFFSLQRRKALHDNDPFFVCRGKTGPIVTDDHGTRFADVTTLFRPVGHATVVAIPVTLGAETTIPCRLVAVRVPKSVADTRRQASKKAAQKHGRTPSQQRWLLSDWTILITNVPAEQLTGQEALVLYRARWHIERLFKVWKSQGHGDESHRKKPWAVVCEGYAKFLAMIIAHWVIVTNLWACPERSMGKACRVVQSHAMNLADGMGGHRRLTHALLTIARSMRSGCSINRRKTAPSTFHLLLESVQEPETNTVCRALFNDGRGI
jgi:hypothetical protein